MRKKIVMLLLTGIMLFGNTMSVCATESVDS